MIEESRTNVAESSEDFGNTSFWLATNQTITTNVATAPDGTLTADNIVPASGSAATRYLYFNASAYSMSASASYTTSIFVKKNGLRYFALQAADNGSGSGLRAGFDLDNGTVVTSNIFGSASGPSASIVEFPNGWFRCILTGTSASGSSTGRTAFSFSSALDSNASVVAITADGSSGGYVWGHQVEAGSFPTSYIPTNGSTVTRAQDTAKITGTNFTDFYNQEEGTLVAHYHSTVDDNYVATFENTATPGDDRIGLINWGGGQGLVETGNSGQANLNNGTPTVGAVNKVAFAFKVNNFAVSLNSATPVTDTSGTMPTVGRMMIGSRADGQYDILKSTIRHLSYYPKRLTDAQLQNLTK